MGGIEAAGAAGLTALLFYRSIAISLILLLPVGGMFLYVWEKEILRKKEREFTRQFLDTLQSVSAALNAGYSLENAMLEAEKEMRIMYREQDRIVREWMYMIRQMKMNLSMERILEGFSWRVDQEDVKFCYSDRSSKEKRRKHGKSDSKDNVSDPGEGGAQ